jgi:UPF0755 protein
MRRVLLLAVSLAGIGALIGYGAVRVFQASGPLPRPAAILIPHGGSDRIAEALLDAGAIRGLRPFRIAAALTAWQGHLHAGEFAFPAHASLEDVLDVLRAGRRIEHKITFPEGWTAAQIALALARTDGITGDIEVPAEGAVLPQTYLFERGATAGSILRRAEAAMREALGQAWTARSPEARLGSSDELVILASLVERETHIQAERPLVARVFLNRLAQGMRLQSDPTEVYAASGGLGEMTRPLTHADLLQANAYNTYAIDGLPAGAICSPGLASIVATAHPARSDALYFVADGSGGHVFAESLGEHDVNVRQFRETRRGR